ncbi:hypothetical protein ACOMHN_011652 [Nucella lapillus]
MEIVAGSYEEIVIGLCLNQKSDESELTETFTEKTIGSIRCVAVSHNGLLASGGTDEVIRIFDLKKRRQVGTLNHHSGTVTSLQFQDTHLFSTSEDGTLCLWRVASWEAERTFRGHKGPVRCVAVHPSGKLTLTVGQDRTLRLWNNITGRIAFISNLKEPAELAYWSLDGLYYVVSYGTRLEVYSVESKCLHRSITTSQKVNSIVFVSDTVVAYGGEGKIRNGEREKAALFFTDILEGHCLHQMETSCDRIRDMSVCDNNLSLVSSDGTVSLYAFTVSSQESMEVELVASRTISLRLTSVAMYSPTQKRREKTTNPEKMKTGKTTNPEKMKTEKTTKPEKMKTEKTTKPEKMKTEKTTKPEKMKTKKRKNPENTDAESQPKVLKKRASEENGSASSPKVKKRKMKMAEPEQSLQKKNNKNKKKLKAPM